MARSVYTLCAEAYSVDRDSGVLSVFKLIERITLPAGAGPIPLRLSVIAVWAAEPGDEPKQFEASLRLVSPDGREIVRPVASPFSFRRELHRVIANVTLGADPRSLAGVGLIQVQPLIREAGAEEWVEAPVYPIRVETSAALQQGRRPASS